MSLHIRCNVRTITGINNQELVDAKFISITHIPEKEVSFFLSFKYFGKFRLLRPGPSQQKHLPSFGFLPILCYFKVSRARRTLFPFPSALRTILRFLSQSTKLEYSTFQGKHINLCCCRYCYQT